jgi:large subunit ribosomal protein L15
MKNHKFKLGLTKVNIGAVQEYITMGRLKPERSDGVLTMKDFVTAGIMPNSSIKTGVKLLGKGSEFLTDKVFIEVPFASALAIEAVEAKGGYVTTVHHNRLALRACLKPHKFPLKPAAMKNDADGDSAEGEAEYLLPKRARPPPKYMEYYTDYAKRGYLNPRVQLERKERGLKDIL